ncbi:MAG: hypothetical protein A3I24_04600 [Candidatus Harrisonbacteria bacterium RIFCSPLOWO2_02_FULL_41_13b]|uniref:Serine aminopeptidase S33 domain-containing protein n=1 Tax=Candidatus Harrisonbacteria bacterium RIFCSPLOWO2_02_FULL_41_13b TaxID=1798409 RepID=A0A1G1ZSF1_9BACT|nr:MAG: hypothetical protein A3J53_02830 [Candidatus Harrisonbacteria bacterium RIFCSPHIGHO2_02_FULL_40_20]OGY66767.1 MAG: hypothetical protein A3I24_04600 [Candidatus Harrisonbacteria bacterium RIFCSPLOWO2_02_FULL_41_13b]
MFLKTYDGVKIAYDLYDVADPKGYVVLTHMMPATKESWRDFAHFAQKQGYASIAIDLRGHGQSDGGPNGYKNFSDEEHQKSILDLNAAVEFLEKQKVNPNNIYFAGASIGANLSLQYLAEHPEFKKAILLSAGLDYRGVKTDRLIKKLKPDQKVLLIAAKDDQRSGGNNAKMNQKLKELAFKNSELIIYETGGHGTDLLKAHSELSKKILEF